MEPKLAAAFLQSVYGLRVGVNLALLIDRLEKQDIDGAIRALNIEPAAFRPLDAAIVAAFEAGGIAAINALPVLRDPAGGQFLIRFNVRNPAAESWLTTHSSQLVQQIIEDQRVAVRQTLTAGLSLGNGPRAIALDVVGRINTATGRREGGIIGLTASQEQWARNYAAELADPKRMADALTRNLRDRRFDRTVAKAIREGKPIPAELRAKMVTAYRNRALRYRGEMVARTEVMSSLHASQYEAMSQVIEKGAVDPLSVTATWHTALDERVRHTHAAMENQKVGWGQSFVSPSGALLRYPGDPDAPAAERIACRCHAPLSIDYLRGIR